MCDGIIPIWESSMSLQLDLCQLSIRNIVAYFTNYSMFNRIPVRCSGWIVCSHLFYG